MPGRQSDTGLSAEPRKRYGQEVKAHREAKGLTLSETARQLGWDKATLSRIENGQMVGSPDTARAFDTFYGTGTKFLTLWDLAKADLKRFRKEYRPYMELEEEALDLRQYCVARLPGLLQTRSYAHEALEAGGLAGDELTEQVEARISRRTLLEGEGAPPFRAILSEATLRNLLSDPAAWREQLEHLLEMSERPNISLHVLPFGSGLHGLITTDVMFLELPDDKKAVYVETDVEGQLFHESGRIESLEAAYDAVRDLAVNPAESRRFILRLLEELPCDPST